MKIIDHTKMETKTTREMENEMQYCFFTNNFITLVDCDRINCMQQFSQVVMTEFMKTVHIFLKRDASHLSAASLLANTLM